MSDHPEDDHLYDVEKPIKRGPGRPRKVLQTAPAAKAPVRHQMKAKPNWEGLDEDDFGVESPDRLGIDPDLVPEGMSLQWVTNTVRGQDFGQHRAQFEKRGWTPVHQVDFEGIFNGMFMPKGADGEIQLEGLVLMARPAEMTRKAKIMERRQAEEAIRIKEQALRGGDLNTSLDSQHPSAIRTNRINRTMERIQIPDER